MSTPAVVLAAGGTGGHIFPAKALAEILAARGITPILLTDGRGEALEVAGWQLAVHRIAAKSPSGSLSARIRGAGALALGTLQAHFLLRRLAPLAVVGFGGFPSVPAVVAADWRRLPIVIHEQNAVLGRANRLLASRAWRIATAFEKVAKTPASETAKLRLVGNPVRPAITQLRAQDFHAPQPGEELSILVTGGSQGATVFADIVPAAALADRSASARRRYPASPCRLCRCRHQRRCGQLFRRYAGPLGRLPFNDLPGRRINHGRANQCWPASGPGALSACHG